MASQRKPANAPRNPVARSAIMKKGGLHQSEKSNDRCTPAQLKHQLDDWREELAFERSLRSKKGPFDSSVFKLLAAHLIVYSAGTNSV